MSDQSFLTEILERKKHEVAALKGLSFPGRTLPARPFTETLDRRPLLAVIAEVKKASPSKGLISPRFDPVATARGYERGGAAAISVLTDEKFFQGSAGDLVAVRGATGLPVLRKDFIIDELQIRHSASLNADAVLLIAEALDPVRLKDLYQAALELGMDPLIELHGIGQLDKVLSLGPRLIGINNRDLSTFATGIETTCALIKEIPRKVLVVAESGISRPGQARMLRDAGVCALLVGKALMRSGDVEGMIGELTLSRDRQDTSNAHSH